MKVYRLEKNGWGVFCSNSGLVYNDEDDSLYHHFGFTCHRQYQRHSSWRSACESIDKLIEYFGSDFAYLLEQGASIVEYNVNKQSVRFGIEEDIEVVFNVSRAKKHVLLQGKDEAVKFKERIQPKFTEIFKDDSIILQCTFYKEAVWV